MGRFGRVPAIPLTAAQSELILAAVLVLAALVLGLLFFELLVTRSAALYLRLTGHKPPLTTSMWTRINHLEEEARRRR